MQYHTFKMNVKASIIRHDLIVKKQKFYVNDHQVIIGMQGVNRFLRILILSSQKNSLYLVYSQCFVI